MQLVKELNIMHKGRAAYMLFRDIETGIPIVYKADKAVTLAITGNLGVYNIENEFGSVSVDVKRNIVPDYDKGMLQMALNAENYDAYLDAAWLNFGLPLLSTVCVLKDKQTKTTNVWCKAFVNAKFARETYNFFIIMAEIVSEQYPERSMITQMDKFVATADEKYVYCGCIMIAYDTLMWLMSDEGRKAFEKRGCAMYSKFIVNTAHIDEFDYKATHRRSERPDMTLIRELDLQAKKNNVGIAKDIQALRNK